MKLTIVSGRSGSGKSICLHMLEDAGFYCVDNLPIGLIATLVEQTHPHYERIVIGIDARNLPATLSRFASIIAELKKIIPDCQVIFLDADDNTLLKRFSETRRKHPLSSEKISLQEALQYEIQLLEPIAQSADLRIDTSHLKVQQLRELIRDRITHQKHNEMSLLFESFGYKYGVPLDADFVFDARCLPNPYWEPELRKHTGTAKEIADFLQKQPQTQQLITDIENFLHRWLPQFTLDNRSYITIGIGCTGGQHRSVYIVEELARFFQQEYKNVQVRHREL